MSKPNNPYNQALADLTDYVNSQLESDHARLNDCVDNDGSDKSFHTLRGRVASLSGVSLQLRKLEQPEPDPPRTVQSSQSLEIQLERLIRRDRKYRAFRFYRSFRMFDLQSV